MWFGIISLFPEMFATLQAGGITARACSNQLMNYALINPRDFAFDVHRTVDDRPYGGGPGMVLKPEPLAHALRVAKLRAPEPGPVICLSPSGRPLTQALVQEFASKPSLILVAGRYEGIDQRFIDKHVDMEVSIGDYILSGGELPAMILMDAVTRLIPGAVSHPLSVQEESFSSNGPGLDWPHYTRPKNYMGEEVPEVLLSGDHQAIAAWRQQQAYVKTLRVRPDLLEKDESPKESCSSDLT